MACCRQRPAAPAPPPPARRSTASFQIRVTSRAQESDIRAQYPHAVITRRVVSPSEVLLLITPARP